MRQPIPFPITVTARPDGADLAVAAEHYEYLLRDIFAVLDEHPELLNDLRALYTDPAPQQDPHDIDQPARDDILAQRIIALLPAASTTIRIHRNPLTRLATAVDAALGRHGWFPAVRGGRAA
ncbi:hypothetical protein [Streptomyces sp. NPDC020983]|uniref:hypothetical protein n=1 Tax=Streptomyces sp. NPDC020983 TaxID=3365106 RepID=UPI00379858FB